MLTDKEIAETRSKILQAIGSAYTVPGNCNTPVDIKLCNAMADKVLELFLSDRVALQQRIAELERATTGAKEIIGELMEMMDWVGTGSTASGREECREYQKRIDALSLPSLSQPEAKTCVWTKCFGDDDTWYSTACGRTTRVLSMPDCNCGLPIEVRQ
jgi:hypothetical protein